LEYPLLGISSSWKIVKVELDMEAKRVVIRAEVDRKTMWCHPDTQLPAALHKWTERSWRHLDTCLFETLISAEVPSVKRKDGSIEEIAVPWAGRLPAPYQAAGAGPVIRVRRIMLPKASRFSDDLPAGQFSNRLAVDNLVEHP
jgi:hypothetical protein